MSIDLILRTMRRIISVACILILIQTEVIAQNYPNIASYHFNGMQTHGVKIKTNIPFRNNLGLPIVKIEGYNYGDGESQPAHLRSKPLSLLIAWEAWNGKFNYPAVSSNGAAIPDVWLSEENGKIVIFIDQKIYFQRFTVSAFAQGWNELPEYFKSWTIVDEPLTNSSTNTLCIYKNNFSGNVGIGTEYPQSMLDVRGKIIADEVQIKVNKGADFVFEPSYNLKSLSEVEEFVKTNKHLPEIPSEKQMIEEGVNVTDIQIKLLQKIEELTLYMIEQDKKIERLQEQLNNK